MKRVFVGLMVIGALLTSGPVAADARAIRDMYEQKVEGPTARAQQLIASARFNVHGTSLYPDATFTLPLSYGSVQGWTEPSGRTVLPFTQFSGLSQRATGASPFDLALRRHAGQGRLRPDTIFDVSTNNDIIGGNSGSPLLDRDGKVVGAVFDGNIHSLGGDYVFDPKLNRTAAVASTAVEEGLVKIYDLKRIVDELKQ